MDKQETFYTWEEVIGLTWQFIFPVVIYMMIREETKSKAKLHKLLPIVGLNRKKSKQTTKAISQTWISKVQQSPIQMITILSLALTSFPD